MQGGGRCAPRERRRGASPEQGRGQPSRPARDKKCVLDTGTRAGGQGGKPRATAPRGNTLQPCPLNTALAEKKPPEGHRCAARSASPAGAGPPARRPLPAQEPDKGNRPTRAEKPPQPNGRLCYARRRWGQRTPRGREIKAGAPATDKDRRSDHRGGAPPARPKRQRAHTTDGAKQVTERGAGRRQRDAGAGATGAPRPHFRDDRAAWYQHHLATTARHRHRGRGRIPPACARRIASVYRGCGGLEYIICRESRAVSTDTALEHRRQSEDVGK